MLGAAYGKGVASCRTEKGWTPPAFFVLEGGSFGLQIGGQAVDVVMLIMNDHGMKSLLNSKFKLGADASVAAGPVGRQAEGSTDITMRAEILTYSRARGIFAGLTLNGASVRQDRDSTRDFYGRMIPFRTLLKGDAISGRCSTVDHRAEPLRRRLERHGDRRRRRAPPVPCRHRQNHVRPPRRAQRKRHPRRPKPTSPAPDQPAPSAQPH